MRCKLSVFTIFVLLLMAGCSGNPIDVTMEYGTEIKLENCFDLKEGESITSDLSVDSKQIGIYDVKATITGKNQAKREEKKKITIEDTKKAKVELMQPTEVIYDIPYKASYNPVGNINAIKDEVDGEYKEIDIVSKDEYDKEIKAINEFRSKQQKQIYTSNEQIMDNKEKRLRSGYTLVTSDVNTKKAGLYTVRISVIDKGYNVTEMRYKVKVKDKGESTGELAVGVEGTKMGKALSYKINDKVNPSAKSKSDKTLSNGAQRQQNNGAGTVSKGTIDAKGSPVLQAALNYVGSHMMCDELVTMALVDGGYLSGTPDPIFKDGNHYNIGVYQMSKLGNFISESEAVPGDLILYNDGGYGSMHVAVYAGNAQAVHGGFNGENVVIHSVNIGSDPRYFRVSPMTWDDVYKKIFPNASNFDSENTIRPNNPNPSAPSTGGSNNIPWDESDWEEGNVICTFRINDVSVTLTSTTPIDENYVYAQLALVDEGQISTDEMAANLAAKGYTIME